jgi:hypothetical protein
MDRAAPPPRRAFERADIVPLAIVSLLLVAAYCGLFGQYAFDDSYIGYSIASSLVSGHGFAFNSGQRFVSTSAPLAVPLYVALSYLFHVGIVQAAQIASAIALAVVAFGSYLILRRFAGPIGAVTGATIMLASPFTLPLWSHESLLYLACSVAALELYLRKRYAAAALIVGLAALFRGEALLIVGFMTLYHWRHGGFKSAATFGAIALAPYAMWALFAQIEFGGFLSQTVASKQAQLHYPMVAPYLSGLRDYAERLFALTPVHAWYVLVSVLALLCVAAAVGCGMLNEAALWTLGWCACTTLLYVALRLPFYFWFCTQVAAALALLVAAAWRSPSRMPLLGAVARSSGLGIAAITAVFAFQFLFWPGEKSTLYNWIIMPSLQGNAYQTLGRWFKTHAGPNDTIAYAEFGQLHYYSKRNIVDYLGLVTPGAAAHLRNSDAIWTFERYRPTWIVDTPDFHYFVDPARYVWFHRAYAKVATMRLQGDPQRSVFTLYRLAAPSQIPTAVDP